MAQLTGLIERGLSLVRLAARVLLAVVVITALVRLLGINLPIRIAEGNLQSLAAMIAAAAFALK